MGGVVDGVGDFFGDLYEGSMQIGEKLGYGVKSKHTKRKIAKAREAARPKRAPLIDDAAVRQMESDRLRRRQGVLANIYGGNNPTAPTVATKQLLGS